jgi:hypothetical protein
MIHRNETSQYAVSAWLLVLEEMSFEFFIDGASHSNGSLPIRRHQTIFTFSQAPTWATSLGRHQLSCKSNQSEWSTTWFANYEIIPESQSPQILFLSSPAGIIIFALWGVALILIIVASIVVVPARRRIHQEMQRIHQEMQ